MGGFAGTPMDYQLLLYIALGLFAMLAVILANAGAKIRSLRKLLEEERRKRTFPMLVFRVDKTDLKAYLKNESYCYAKQISFDDLDLTVEYGFKKKLKLRFDAIAMLKPGQEVRLTYRVFDNDFDVTPQSPDSLVLQFHDNPFTMQLGFENLENEKFRSTIVWQDGDYVVKEVHSLEQKPTP
jgi:hypothetical protein